MTTTMVKKDYDNIPEVRIVRNGPVIVRGLFKFRQSDGEVIQKEQELHLCRCGKSSRMPFCDDTHKKPA